jgi:hypothetical protein
VPKQSSGSDENHATGLSELSVQLIQPIRDLVWVFEFATGHSSKCALGYGGLNFSQCQLQGLHALVAFAVDSEGDAGGFLFFFAEDEHRVSFIHLGIADFAADFVAGKIRAAADAGGLELVEDLPGVFILVLGDG